MKAHRQGCGVQGVRPVPGEGRRHWQDHFKEQETPQEVPTNPQTPKTAHHATPTTVSPPPGLPTPVPRATSHQPKVRAYLPQPVMTVPDQVHPSLRSEQHLPDTPEPIPDALPDTPEPIPAMFQVQGSPTPTSPPRQGHLAVPNPPPTLSAPSPVQSLRPQRHRRPNVRLDPAKVGAGQNGHGPAVHPHHGLVLGHDQVDCPAGGGWGEEGGRR